LQFFDSLTQCCAELNESVAEALNLLLWFRENIKNLHGDLLRAVEAGLEGKPFEPPTIEERLDEARRKILQRLRQRSEINHETFST
tara:strand:+ start:646 stop:903 length:258 start_codon:yes stop_codon:yes gene_type:complete